MGGPLLDPGRTAWPHAAADAGSPPAVGVVVGAVLAGLAGQHHKAEGTRGDGHIGRAACRHRTAS